MGTTLEIDLKRSHKGQEVNCGMCTSFHAQESPELLDSAHCWLLPSHMAIRQDGEKLRSKKDVWQGTV